MPATHTHGSTPTYRRRTPETEPLYQVLADHVETFIEHTRSSDRQLPVHVEEELRAYLRCGILAHGLLRVRCEDCSEDRVVAFSCQRRSFCPSCMGRRMADTAARLTDEVLPRVPVRQWVLSLPYEIRYRLAWDKELVGAVLAVFLRVVFGWYRRQARAQGYEDSRCGSVTFVQRFGSALNLNPHSHVLMIDGVYVDGGFHPEPGSHRRARRPARAPTPARSATGHPHRPAVLRLPRFLSACGHPRAGRRSHPPGKTVPLRQSTAAGGGTPADPGCRESGLRPENDLVRRHLSN
jgi:hypothetical protein